MDQDKAVIRNRVRMARAGVSPLDLIRASELIRQNLHTLDEFIHAQRVLCYSSLKEEVQTSGIIGDCLDAGKEVFLPYQLPKDHRLAIGRYLDGDVLIPGPYGVLEPAMERRNPSLAVGNLDLILVPGVAFDPRGNRIGYGKGYYDRLLAGAGENQNPSQPGKAPVTVGLALEIQIVAGLDLLPFDVPVEILISENRVIRSAGDNYP